MFFGASVGSIEAVWSIPKLGQRSHTECFEWSTFANRRVLGANLPKFSSQLKHIGGRCVLFGVAGTLFATIEYAAVSAEG